MDGDVEIVYRTGNSVELETAKAILEEEGLDVVVRDMTITPYPAVVGMGVYELVVPVEEAEDARELLILAAEDELLEKGNII
jgi:hypothetical protein